MKNKTILVSASLILTGFLILAIGFNLGIGVGEAKFHNERVRWFQSDVMETAKLVESPAKEMLIETARFAGQMINVSRYREARPAYETKIQNLQNNAP